MQQPVWGAWKDTCRMTKARAYGRVGLLGNPSDMYGGKGIGFTFDRTAEVEVSDSLEWKVNGEPVNVDDYGSHRLVKSTVNYLGLKDKLAVKYSSNIPRGLGLGGSSAIIIAAIRAINEHFEVCLDDFQIAEFATYTERERLGIAAGFLDRYTISFEGLLFMDFEGKEEADKLVYGKYERLNAGDMPYFLVLGYGKNSSGSVHNSLWERFRQGDKSFRASVKGSMDKIAALAVEGKEHIKQRNWRAVGKLMNENHLLRKYLAEKYHEHGLFRKSDDELVDSARKCGALGAKVAGSGGAVVVLGEQDVFDRMKCKYGDKCFRAKIMRKEK